MNQIETLKYIAENGNPIGTPAESDYNQYKSDPTFRKLAIQAAEGGNLIGSPLESDYKAYKDTVNTTTQSQQPVQDPLLANSDTNGQTFLEPDIQPGGVNPYTGQTAITTPKIAETIGSTIRNNPGTTAALVGSALIPGSIPMISGLAAGILGSGGETIDKIHPFTKEPNEWKTGNTTDNIVDVLGAGMGMGLGTWFGNKLTSRLGEIFGQPERNMENYQEALVKQAENKTKLDNIEQNVRDIRQSYIVDELDPNSSIHFIDQYINASDKTRPKAQRQLLDAIKSQMLSDNTKKYRRFAAAYQPTDEEALNYYNSIKSDIEPPRGINLLRMAPNAGRTISEGVFGGKHGWWNGKIYDALTNNFIIPKIMNAAIEIPSRPLTVGLGYGGYEIGNKAEFFPKVYRDLKKKAEDKKNQLEFIKNISGN